MTPTQTIRERTEEIERLTLSDLAVRSQDTKGRDRDEMLHPMRTAFQRDRDRVVHSKAFRRLKHKTQVFLAPEGDHYRVRLTHTLEVAQIARTVARALRLNEDLTEAIALGHDLGHTPFGHLGEEALTPFLGRPFRHNEQSLRIVDHLENEGLGLNLTWEVRDGIVNHTWSMPLPSTLEGQCARFADRIAYVNHDVDDAIRAGVLGPDDLPDGATAVLGATHGERIDTLVTDLVTTSQGSDRLGLSQPVFEALDVLRDFMFEHVYLRSEAADEQRKAVELVSALFRYYLEHPEALPAEARIAPGELPDHVADHIAGMTDRYALRTYERLFLPPGWLL
jgi:dGTPase